jgi:hypothetical protein
VNHYALIEGRPYATEAGAWVHAKRAGWAGPGGGPLGVEATMAKLARAYRGAVLVREDGSVTTYAFSGGKVRRRTAEAGSDEARWLAGRLADALGG